MRGDSADAYLEAFQRVEFAPAWLEAGALRIGAFYMGSYELFYDLRSGKVCYVHEEDIYESSLLVEDWDKPAAIRSFLEQEALVLCQDWNTFLRLTCLGEPCEDRVIFLGE